MDTPDWEWKSDLAKDIHDTLKDKESSMAKLKGQSKQLYWRRYLVDWLALTCQKYNLNSNAQHLAVCLYDQFTDQFELPVEDVQMLVLCCLLIACKFEEREEQIPKFKTLMRQLHWKLDCKRNQEKKHNGQVTEKDSPLPTNRKSGSFATKKAKEYLHMEVRILSALNWKISFPTAAHFKEYYMQVALGTQDMMSGGPILNKEETLMYLEKNVNYFLEVSLQDHAFLVFKPSLITASSVAAARVCLRISPTWSVELQQITNYSWQHLAPCIEILLRYKELLYDEDRRASPKSSNDVLMKSNLDSAGSTPVQSPVLTLTSSEKAYCSSTFPRSAKSYLV